MGTNPLDTAFAGASARKQSKRGIAYMAILGAAGLASVSSVFAASVGINSGNDIIYSQGVETIAACDTDIDAELGAFFNGTAFELDTIELTGIASGCDNGVLTLNLYDGTVKMLTVVGTLNVASATSATIGQADTAIAAVTVASGTSSSDFTNLDGARSIAFENSKTAALLASDADRIVIEIN